MQGRQPSQSIWRRFVVGLRRVVARCKRQARTPSIRPSKDSCSAVSRSGISTHLFRRRKLRRCQGEVPSMGRRHVASIWSSLQSAHRTCWDLGLGRQIGNARDAIEHRNVALDQRYREVEETALLKWRTDDSGDLLYKFKKLISFERKKLKILFCDNNFFLVFIQLCDRI